MAQTFLIVGELNDETGRVMLTFTTWHDDGSRTASHVPVEIGQRVPLKVSINGQPADIHFSVFPEA